MFYSSAFVPLYLEKVLSTSEVVDYLPSTVYISLAYTHLYPTRRDAHITHLGFNIIPFQIQVVLHHENSTVLH